MDPISKIIQEWRQVKIDLVAKILLEKEKFLSIEEAKEIFSSHNKSFRR